MFRPGAILLASLGILGDNENLLRAGCPSDAWAEIRSKAGSMEDGKETKYEGSRLSYIMLHDHGHRQKRVNIGSTNP